MKTFIVRIALCGFSSSWRVTYVAAATAERAIDLAEQRELSEGYAPIACLAEGANDPHDCASKGVWPFAVAS